jgi:hypothetical protein
LVDRLEESLDPAAASRAADHREDELHLHIEGDLFKML